MAADDERRRVYKGLLANPEFVKEFYARVRAINHPDACWIWQGYIDNFGFGRVRSGKRTFGAHRVAYELEHGPVSKNTIVKQECNCRACCRVDHLVATTRKRKGQKGSWKPYVDNLTSLTASIFEEDSRDLIGGVKVVFGDDPQVAVDKLSPLLRTLGEAVSRCVKLQGDILDGFTNANSQLAAIPGLAKRHVELLATVERIEESLSSQVSRETSRQHPLDIARETLPRSHYTATVSRPTTAGYHDVSRETPRPTTAGYHDVSRETSRPATAGYHDEERLRIQRTLAELFSREVGPCDDAHAVYATYELALAHGGTQAGTLLGQWMQAFGKAVQAGNQLPLAGRFLAWVVARLNDAETPDDLDAPEASRPEPDASPSTPEAPAPSSPSSEPTPPPPDPPPSHAAE